MAIKKADLLFFGLFVGLFLLVFREFFFTDRVFFERDSSVIEIPVRKLTAQLLKEGRFALWTDAYGNGQPFLANPKNAVLYPTTWLYLLLPLFIAFKLHYLIHAVLGWLGLYVLCRSFALSRRASFLGASLFTFSGMYLSSFEFYNHIAALAWMPWILWLLHREGRAGWTRVLVPAFFWALMILAGAPEFILMTLLFAAGQAFFKPGGWKKRMAIILGSLCLGVLITAVQLIPSFELLSRTERASQSGQWPLELVQLLNLPFPHFLGNDREPGHHDFWGWHLFDKEFPLYYSLYMGFGALLLALFGLRPLRGRPRKVLLLMAAVFFLLACGRYSPFFFLYRYVPMLSSIRFPIKFLLGSVFCLALLAAFGFDGMTTAAKPGRRAVLAAALPAGLGLLLFELFRRPVLDALNVLFVIDRDSSLRELGRSIETGLLLLAVFALLLAGLRYLRRTAVLGWALMVLAVLDPAYHNRYVNPTTSPSFYRTAPVVSLPAPPVAIYRDEVCPPFLKSSMADDLRLFRFFRESLYPFTGLGEGVRYVFNWDFYGTYPARDLEVRRAVRELPPQGQFKVLNYVGCAALISYQPLFSGGAAVRLKTEGPDVWLERIATTSASPYVAFQTAKADALKDQLALFTREDFDPLRTVIVDRDVLPSGPPGTAGAPSGETVVRKEIQGEGRYAVTLSREGLLVIPGHKAPGWRAWVDGRKTPVIEANIFSKGVVVPSGRHEIVLSYQPASFLWGAAASLISLGLCLGGVAVAPIRSRKRGRPASS